MLGAGAVARPEPESATVRKPPATLPATKSAAVRAPAPDGVNTTFIAQFAAGASVKAQVVASEKSRVFAPPIAKEPRANDPALPLEIVTICAELELPTVKLPKFKLLAD